MALSRAEKDERIKEADTKLEELEESKESVAKEKQAADDKLSKCLREKDEFLEVEIEKLNTWFDTLNYVSKANYEESMANMQHLLRTTGAKKARHGP